MIDANITFIGAGNIARALVAGLLANGFKAQHIFATSPDIENLNHFKEQFSINVTLDNREGASHADVLVLAVKPNILPEVCNELKDIVATKKPLIISVAAGVTESLLQKWLACEAQIIRAMPNTPAMVGASATGLYANDKVSDAQKDIAESIFRAVGIALWVDTEQQIDMVTAISGSGPAYCFLFMEIMQQAAETIGLPADVARLLVSQTALGAARMVMETSSDITELRQSVTSPKGTTEAAIKVMQAGQIHALITDALQAAYQRAQQLKQEF